MSDYYTLGWLCRFFLCFTHKSYYIMNAGDCEYISVLDEIISKSNSINPSTSKYISFLILLINIDFTIITHMLIRYPIIALLLLLALAQEDAGLRRLKKLQERSLNFTNRIINFTKSDFDQYVMKYPRPYDVVLYFHANKIPLSNELYKEYEYLVHLYDTSGAITAERNPTFFALVEYSRDTSPIYEMFEFDSVPDMVVSKPHMAVVSEVERRQYLQELVWEISHTDNHVTTHKMLEFVNKRTKKEVEFRHTEEKIKQVIGYFLLAAFSGVLAFFLLKPIWNHWLFWFLASIAVYLTCCSGIVYCHLHDSPWTSGQGQVFSGGNREQSGLEGWVISGVIVLVSLMFVLIGVAGEKCSHKFSSLFCILALVVVYLGVTYLQQVYKQKGWYGPSFAPPQGYLKGPLNVDQGNNI